MRLKRRALSRRRPRLLRLRSGGRLTRRGGGPGPSLGRPPEQPHLRGRVFLYWVRARRQDRDCEVTPLKCRSRGIKAEQDTSSREIFTRGKCIDEFVSQFSRHDEIGVDL